MTLTIKIDCDNAAFAEDFARQLADILEDCRDIIKAKGETFTEMPLYDSNGNKVGRMTLGCAIQFDRINRHLDELSRLVNEAQKYPHNYANFNGMRSVIELAKTVGN